MKTKKEKYLDAIKQGNISDQTVAIYENMEMSKLLEKIIQESKDAAAQVVKSYKTRGRKPGSTLSKAHKEAIRKSVKAYWEKKKEIERVYQESLEKPCTICEKCGK